MNITAWMALSTLVLFALKKWLELREALRSIQCVFYRSYPRRHIKLWVNRHHPWTFTLVSSFGLAGAVFEKPIRFIARGGARNIVRKYLDFQEAGLDIISAVSNMVL